MHLINLRANLDGEDDIFSNLSYAQLMFQEFPVISLIVERIRKFLATKFLPKEVSNVLHSMLEFNDSYLRLAYSLDGHEADVHQQGDVLAEVYPGLPQHSANERFHADKHKDPGEIKNCHKEYPEASGITGGLGHKRLHSNEIWGKSGTFRQNSFQKITQKSEGRKTCFCVR